MAETLDLQGAVDLICLNCTQDTLNHPEVCKECTVRQIANKYLKKGEQND